MSLPLHVNIMHYVHTHTHKHILSKSSWVYITRGSRCFKPFTPKPSWPNTFLVTYISHWASPANSPLCHGRMNLTILQAETNTFWSRHIKGHMLSDRPRERLQTHIYVLGVDVHLFVYVYLYSYIITHMNDISTETTLQAAHMNPNDRSAPHGLIPWAGESEIPLGALQLGSSDLLSPARSEGLLESSVRSDLVNSLAIYSNSCGSEVNWKRKNKSLMLSTCWGKMLELGSWFFLWVE